MKSKRGNILVVFLLIPFLIILFGFIIPSWYNSVDTFYRPTAEDIAQLQSEPDTMSLANYEIQRIYPGCTDEAYADGYEKEKAEAIEEMKEDPERWVAMRLGGCHDAVVDQYWVDQWAKRTPPITLSVADIHSMKQNPEKWLKKYDNSLADRLAVFLFFVLMPCFPLFGIALVIVGKLKSLL